jgi:hypothetical protein
VFNILALHAINCYATFTWQLCALYSLLLTLKQLEKPIHELVLVGEHYGREIQAHHLGVSLTFTIVASATAVSTNFIRDTSSASSGRRRGSFLSTKPTSSTYRTSSSCSYASGILKWCNILGRVKLRQAFNDEPLSEGLWQLDSNGHL